MKRHITFEPTPCFQAMFDIAANLDVFPGCRPHAAYFIDNSHPICVHVNGVHAAFIYLSGVEGSNKLMISLCAPTLHRRKWSTIKLVWEHLRQHIDRELCVETENQAIIKLCEKLGIN